MSLRPEPPSSPIFFFGLRVCFSRAYEARNGGARPQAMIQRLRLASGLVLFTYVTSHLLNHALGMIGLDAAEAGRLWFTAFWRWPLTTLVLYTSLTVHI